MAHARTDAHPHACTQTDTHTPPVVAAGRTNGKRYESSLNCLVDFVKYIWYKLPIVLDKL